MSDLRERVARAIWMADIEPLEEDDCIPLEEAHESLRAQVYVEADAAIALIRGEVLEEAARVCERELIKDPWKDADYGWNAAIEENAAAIRALKTGGKNDA